MARMKVIVYPPIMEWHWMKQRPHHILLQFARNGYTVYFINRTSSRQPIEQIEPGIFVVHDEQQWFMQQWPKIQERSGEIGIYTTSPLIDRSIRQYRPEWIWYDCCDEIAGWQPVEPDIVHRADLITCASLCLYERFCKQYPSKLIALIPNGYDPDLKFHEPPPTECPDDLKPWIKSPLVGYIGAYAPWVEETLFTRICEASPDVHVALIGPDFNQRFSRNHPHIHVLGHKPHHELRNYIHWLSVCLIPFRITPITRASDPIKAYEYLAAGKPVVSTRWNCPPHFYPYIDFVNHPDQWVQQVMFRLHDSGNVTVRQGFALNHTWAHRYLQIQQMLERK